MCLKNLAKQFTVIYLMLGLTAVFSFSQTGGSFEIEKSVVASGGNTSSGGSFTLESTSGQKVLDATPQGGTFQIFTGFWTPQFAPTAAATISGKVLQSNGRGIPRAIVSSTDSSGNIKIARTNLFGNFRFTNVEIGQTYIFEVSAKGYLFAPQVVNVQDNISGLNFSPLGKEVNEKKTVKDIGRKKEKTYE